MGIGAAIAYIAHIGIILYCHDDASFAGTALMLGRHVFTLAVAGLLSASLGATRLPAADAEGYDPWPGLVQDIFNNRPMNDGSDVIGARGA